MTIHLLNIDARRTENSRSRTLNQTRSHTASLALDLVKDLYRNLHALPFSMTPDGAQRCCVLMAASLRHALEAVGIHGELRACGRHVRRLENGRMTHDQIYGDRRTLTLPGCFNGHLVVSCDDTVIDPTLGGGAPWWNHLPPFATFRARRSKKWVSPSGEVLEVFGKMAFEPSEGVTILVNYFELPKSLPGRLDWMTAPDMAPERSFVLAQAAVAARAAALAKHG